VQGTHTYLIAEHCWSKCKVAVLLILGLSLVAVVGSASAQENGAVQQSTGRIEPGEVVLYQLLDL